MSCIKCKGSGWVYTAMGQFDDRMHACYHCLKGWTYRSTLVIPFGLFVGYYVWLVFTFH